VDSVLAARCFSKPFKCFEDISGAVDLLLGGEQMKYSSSKEESCRRFSLFESNFGTRWIAAGCTNNGGMVSNAKLVAHAELKSVRATDSFLLKDLELKFQRDAEPVKVVKNVETELLKSHLLHLKS